MKWSIIVAVLFVMILSSCYNDSIESLTKVDICDVTEVTYSRDVTKILNNSCALSGCHNVDALLTFPLTNYDEVMPVVEDGRLLKAIKHESGALPMPKNTSKLDDCSIKKIEAWINAGSLNN